jgi:hypothetical protein
MRRCEEARKVLAQQRQRATAAKRRE